MKKETATFAMGCFWEPDLLFSKLPGTIKVEVGYMGGDEEKFPNPTYNQICYQNTGYAEVVQVTFNPEKTSYEELLKLFWENHNPTTLNRQGLDFGSQYRSAIFYHSEKQKTKAQSSKKEIQKKLSKKVVTEITKAKTFFIAEDKHQKYLQKRGQNTC